MKERITTIEKQNKFKWELNDLRALMTIMNVIGVIVFGFIACYLALSIAIIGLIRDIIEKKKINSYIIHISNCILNIYLMMLLSR